MKASIQSYADEGERQFCDEELVKQFEDGERAKGVLSEGEIGRESSNMIGKFLERKWTREGERDVVLASGRVRKLPGSVNVGFRDEGIWR